MKEISRVKSILYFLVLIILITLITIFIIKLVNDTVIKELNINEVFKDPDVPFIEIEPVETYNQKEAKQWYLLLVGKNNPIPDAYEFELEYLNSSNRFDSRAIDELSDMIKAAKDDGVTIKAQSTYRSPELQARLLEREKNKFLNKGYDSKKALELAMVSILPANSSEHNLGLAVDFSPISLSFENTDSFDWLFNNSHLYGFILRYPEDKKEITGIKYEPWHYRYVSVEHATKMKELDLCLEEYHEYLNNN